jgi:Leucine-rich repeat (LRR) protein
MNADEMSEFFDMIVEKNTNILNFSIMHKNTYRLDDLSTLLRKNKSLHEVTIVNCDVQVGEYSSTLADVLSDLSVLSDTHSFEKLDIFNSRIFGDEKSIKALIDSLHLIRLTELDISDNEIKHLRWVKA